MSIPPRDPTANRHHGNPASEEAWRETQNRQSGDRQRKIILDLITKAGTDGMTSGEIEERLSLAKNRFSGRLTELKVLQLIRGQGYFRDGCEVLVAAVHLPPKITRPRKTPTLFDNTPQGERQ